jgi:hypothetical protein
MNKFHQAKLDLNGKKSIFRDRTNSVKMLILLSKASYRFNALPIKISMAFLNGKPNAQIHNAFQEAPNSQTHS